MNRQQYYWARSLARTCVRRTELLVEQDAPTVEVERARRSEAWAIARVPGGLKQRWFYHGTCLLSEWCARRNKVRRQIQLRHCAERAARHYPSTPQGASL